MIRVTRSSKRKEELEKAKTEIKNGENNIATVITEIQDTSEIPNRQKPNKQSSNRRALKSKSKSSDILLLSPVTPPKQRKSNDSDNTKNSTTPSSLLKKLSLKSPLKKPVPTIRTSLFSTKQKEEDGQENLAKSKQEVKKSVDNISEEIKVVDTKQYTQYQNARKALHSNFPTELPGRESEIEELRSFILDHLVNGSSGSIYVSGPPGTGKTASLNSIVQQTDVSGKNKVIM